MRKQVFGVFVGLGLIGGCGGSGMEELTTTGPGLGVGDGTTEGDDGETQASGDADAGQDDAATGSGDGATDDAQLDGTGGGGDMCEQAAFSFSLEPGTPRVMLLLDKSRSMTNLWDHDLDPLTPDISRWHSLHNVVELLTEELAGSMDFGAQLFPSATAYLDEPINTYSCHVEGSPEVAVGVEQGAAIIDAIPAAEDLTISGGTPATAGMHSAIDHLTSLGGDEPRAIVLVTDGAANCNPGQAPADTLFVYDADLPGVVGDAFETHQIPTYVVGINILDQMGTKPAVNPMLALTDVALAGGVPAAGDRPFYNAFNEEELASALAQVTAKIECTIPLEDEPLHPDLVEVTVAGGTYARVTDCATENGWVYTSPDGPHNAIELCGVACDALQTEGLVDVDYLCPE